MEREEVFLWHTLTALQSEAQEEGITVWTSSWKYSHLKFQDDAESKSNEGMDSLEDTGSGMLCTIGRIT